MELDGIFQIIVTVGAVIGALGLILKTSKGWLVKWLNISTPEDVLEQIAVVIENQNVMNENILAVQHKAEDAPGEMNPEVAAAWEIILAQMNHGHDE